MRLVCPNCETQYEVADGAIPGGGREVQCGACNQSWFQTPIVPDTSEPEQPDTGTEFTSTRPKSHIHPDKVAEAQAAIAAAAANIETMVRGGAETIEAEDAVAEDAPAGGQIEDNVADAPPPPTDPRAALAAISERMRSDDGSAEPGPAEDVAPAAVAEAVPETTVGATPDADPAADPGVNPDVNLEATPEAETEIDEAAITAALERMASPSDPVATTAPPEPMDQTPDAESSDSPDTDENFAGGVDENLADEIRRLSEEMDAETPFSQKRPQTSGATAVLGAVSATAAAFSDKPLETESLAARLKQRVADAARSQSGAAGIVGTAPAAGPQVFGASAEAVRQASQQKDNNDLPDAEELSSSLRPKSGAKAPSGRVSTLAVEADMPPPRNRGFSFGIGTALGIFLVGLAAYMFSPTISARVPAMAPALSAYSQNVDKFRHSVAGLLGRAEASDT